MTQAEAATPALTTPTSSPRIFYGWYIVIGAIVAQFVAIGMQGGVSGVFLRPMTEDLGWTRAEFTIATSLGTGVSGLIGFFIGTYVDRLGARPLMVIGVTIVGGTLLATSRVEELWQFIVLRGIAFTIGFVLIGNLVVNVTVAKWFVEKRGWAISLASLGISASGMVMPLVMVRIVDTMGWRDGWVLMGLGAWLFIYPVALIMRRQPEDHGMLPDGRVEGRAGDEEAVERSRLDYVNSYTRGEAIRTLAMWLLIFAFGFAMVGLISLLFHSIPFLTDNGFTRTDASIIAASQGASALVSKFVWGWAMQRFHPRALAALSFMISGVAVLSMVPIAASGSVPLMFAAYIAWGWGIGGMMPLSEFIWASFYGRRYLGAVRSAGMPVTIIFGAAGPYFAGAYFDAVGSYDGALVTFASLWFIATLLILLARQPKAKVPVTAPVAPITPDQPAAFFEAGAPLLAPGPRHDLPDGAVTAGAPPRARVDLREPAIDLGGGYGPPGRTTRSASRPARQPALPPRAVEREQGPELEPQLPPRAVEREADPEPPPREPLEVSSPMDQPMYQPRPRPPLPRPRNYMTDEDGRQPVRDYMHKQLDAPGSATGQNGQNGQNGVSKNGAGDAGFDSGGGREPNYGFTALTQPEPEQKSEPDYGFAALPEVEVVDDVVPDAPDATVDAPQRPPVDESADGRHAADDRGTFPEPPVMKEPAPAPAAEAPVHEAAVVEEPEPAAEELDPVERPPRRYQPPPAWAPAPPALPSSGPGGGLRLDVVVNLGEASRALQRRIPAAIAYYRRDGVSSAVWAGVATSVAVTAAVWLLNRNGR